jgi:cytochrome d ubiquinol oxidase subunit I
VSWWLRARGRLFAAGWFLRCCEIAAPYGFLAVLAGWTTTEVGRQPWTVYGLMRTAESVSPSLTGSDVLISLLGYGAVYLIMFPAGVALMARIVARGPGEASAEPVAEDGRRR